MSNNPPAIELELWDDIYNATYFPYLDLTTRTQIFFGGSSSGKSFFLAQRCVEDLLQGDRNYLITRAVGNTIKTSVFNEVTKAIADYGVGYLFDINKSDMIITCKINRKQAIFKGLDDQEKIKSVTPINGVITDIWVEEATECAYEAIKQLNKRLRGKSRVPKRLILSFNPIYKTHWIFEQYFVPIGWTDDQRVYEGDHLFILKTTYKANEWLEEDDIYELENEADEYYRDVYTYGNWGILGDAILTNWKVADLSDMMVQFDNIRNGFDFGYSQDPASYVRMHYDGKNKRIYIFDGWEERKLTNPATAGKLKPIVGEEPVFCDSAEPKSIQELQENGINAVATKKGKDSVLHGLQWLQQHEIIVDKRLQHVINELTIHSWKKDKDGNSLPIPEDANNHSIDAIRYGLEIEFGGFFGGLL